MDWGKRLEIHLEAHLELYLELHLERHSEVRWAHLLVVLSSMNTNTNRRIWHESVTWHNPKYTNQQKKHTKKVKTTAADIFFCENKSSGCWGLLFVLKQDKQSRSKERFVCFCWRPNNIHLQNKKKHTHTHTHTKMKKQKNERLPTHVLLSSHTCISLIMHMSNLHTTTMELQDVTRLLLQR